MYTHTVHDKLNLVKCGIPGNFTAKNTAEFRGIPYFFQKIPYSVGSQKRTSVDTLVPPNNFIVEKLPTLGKRNDENVRT
jgi:hypothetical protein